MKYLVQYIDSMESNDLYVLREGAINMFRGKGLCQSRIGDTKMLTPPNFDQLYSDSPYNFPQQW